MSKTKDGYYNLNQWEISQLEENLDKAFPRMTTHEQLPDYSLEPSLLTKRVVSRGKFYIAQSFDNGNGRIVVKWARWERPMMKVSNDKGWEIEFDGTYFRLNEAYYKHHVNTASYFDKLPQYKNLWFPFSDTGGDTAWGKDGDFSCCIHHPVMWHVEYIKNGNTEYAQQLYEWYKDNMEQMGRGHD